jgi:hypothetical protein
MVAFRSPAPATVLKLRQRPLRSFYCTSSQSTWSQSASSTDQHVNGPITSSWTQNRSQRCWYSSSRTLSEKDTSNNQNDDLAGLFPAEPVACPINGSFSDDLGYAVDHQDDPSLPGQRAFVECDRAALIDLFTTHARDCSVSGRHLDRDGLAKIMKAVGENADDATIDKVFSAADVSGDGLIQLEVRCCSHKRWR